MKWHLLSVWHLWMWARLISAHDAPKGLGVSNMIQQSVLDSLVAAAYILIISREPERCRGSAGLRQHERYQSLAFQRRGDAGPFRGHVWHNGFCLTLSVTVSDPNSAKGALCPLCHASHAQFCLFDSAELWTFVHRFVKPDSNCESGFYLSVDAFLVWKASHTTSKAGEASLCACLNHCYRPGRMFCSATQYIQLNGNTQNLSFSNQWQQFQWTIFYSFSFSHYPKFIKIQFLPFTLFC